MTEREWQACEDPRPMLGVVKDRTTDRKMRLFVLSCCRSVGRCVTGYPRAVAALESRIEGAVTEHDFQKALDRASAEVYGCVGYPGDASGYADGAVAMGFWHILRGNWEELTTAASQAVAYDALTQSSNPELQQLFAFWKMWRTNGSGFETAEETIRSLPEYLSALDIERSKQADFLRDIFGNPFRPVSFDPSWRTSTVTTLAQMMYDSRDFSTMPILADALQDAGCDNDDALSHCRNTSHTHIRGCWVIDLVLGKE